MPPATRLLMLLGILALLATTHPATAAVPADVGTPEAGTSKMETAIIGTLVLISIISIALIIERGLALRRNKVIPPELITAQRQYLSPEDLPGLRALCDRYPSAHGRLLACAIDHRHLPRQEITETLQTRARHEINRMERGLVVLEITTGIAPLMGLVGTIFGLIVLFKGMSGAGGNDSALFATGISIALRATLMGLVIAIPSLTAWSGYNRKVEALAVELENLSDEFLRTQHAAQKQYAEYPA